MIKNSKYYLNILFLILGSFTICLDSFCLTVQEAYEAIPHRRTVFDYNKSLMFTQEKKYLSKVFNLTDLATVEKGSMLIRLTSEGQAGEVANNYSNILNRLYEINPPAGLVNFHKLIISSIEEQRKALYKWENSLFDYSKLSKEMLVRSSSAKLKRAYSILMKKYPKEGNHNKQAFFDHLCALEFI